MGPSCKSIFIKETHLYREPLDALADIRIGIFLRRAVRCNDLRLHRGLGHSCSKLKRNEKNKIDFIMNNKMDAREDQRYILFRLYLKVSLRGCLCEKNCPGLSPANQGSRFAGLKPGQFFSHKHPLRRTFICRVYNDCL